MIVPKCCPSPALGWLIKIHLKPELWVALVTSDLGKGIERVKSLRLQGWLAFLVSLDGQGEMLNFLGAQGSCSWRW